MQQRERRRRGSLIIPAVLGWKGEGSGSLSTAQWRVQFKRDKRLPCQRCGGASKLICHACSGAGRLGKGGYHEKNPIMSARLVGSKWTAMERTLGWRHFQVTAKRKTAGETYVCLVSTCGQHNNAGATLWLNSAVLKSRRAWAPGWLQRTEIDQITGETAGSECKVCSGHGSLPCLLCSSGGTIVQL
ncbi:hypothetical protein COCOBI_17-1760 [Coccomyxa sp. Obi]|nr:hypothetical protein COCOBI_17-1760 [Coccomyxa sp. Obi]